jgi:hypothetical protein
MIVGALQRSMTWAEDRATQRCDPSAVPGAKTGARAEPRCSALLPFFPLRDWHRRAKPSRHDAAIPRHDADLNPLTPAPQIPVPGEPGQLLLSFGVFADHAVRDQKRVASRPLVRLPSLFASLPSYAGARYMTATAVT